MITFFTRIAYGHKKGKITSSAVELYNNILFMFVDLTFELCEVLFIFKLLRSFLYITIDD